MPDSPDPLVFDVASSAADLAACMAIARGLPDYFNDPGLRAMEADLGRHEPFVARRDGAVVGFLTLEMKNAIVAEITWMAVRKDRLGAGIGSALLEHVARHASDLGFRLLVVKTLAPTVDYPPYAGTRSFYAKHEFIPIETVDPYPPWGDGNPCLISVRVLG
jgi:GNAT superfamily N-acetyltransferase